jgi:hypothetical protein
MSRSTTKNVARRPISITAVVDCVGSLATRSLGGNLYLFDTNRAGGSTGLGSEELRTVVRKGDTLLWTAFALECEVFVSIADIAMETDLCEPVRRVYPGTDVAYWTATIKRDVAGITPYRLSFRLGSRVEPMTTPCASALVGASEGGRKR